MRCSQAITSGIRKRTLVDRLVRQPARPSRSRVCAPPRYNNGSTEGNTGAMEVMIHAKKVLDGAERTLGDLCTR